MLRRNPCGSDTVLAREADLLALAGVQGASHLKVGTTDRFHNVVKIRPPMPFDADNADYLLDCFDRIMHEDFVRR